ncbi:MAG TPA: metalloregulator ArsR/SmtB family transcription factor [Gemmatimonadaceae bacterium]|nr:metalloregulator ArsR/SmtB family transcription factor [Gemmatimonadaceae bacterium]
MPPFLANSDVFFAVSDPTRRAILDRLRLGEAPVNELAAGFRMSRPAVSKHLRILRTARLVNETKSGRQRIYKLEADRIREVAQWAEQYRAFWQDNITRLKRHLESPPKKETK